MVPIIECVPNFSEGRDLSIIEAIKNSINSIPEIHLLHTDIGYDANRTVITFAGPPENVITAAFNGIETASKLIDMRQQSGAHPRIGATDVCPLIPISNISIEEVNLLAHRLGQKVGTNLHIPVYMYEYSASKKERRNLAHIRRGEYEGFSEKMSRQDWLPDYGPSEFNEKSGVTAIGARHFLIAYNVNLDTTDVKVAKKIAASIRASGHFKKDSDGRRIRVPGKCKSLKAIGWLMESYGCAQVSMNLVNFKETSLATAFEACKTAAGINDVEVTGSELIGMVPLEAILDAGRYYAQGQVFTDPDLIQLASRHLNLNEISAFVPHQRIIEFMLNEKTFFPKSE